MPPSHRTAVKTRRLNNPILPRKKIKREILCSQYVNCEAASSSSSINSQSNEIPASFDITSQQGKFTWTSVNDEYLPCIFRNNEQFCSLIMAEIALFSKYFSRLHSSLFKFKELSSYHPTFHEINLLKEINEKHCNGLYGKNYSGGNDYIIHLDDVVKLIKFLNFCNEKIQNPCHHISPNSPCGFIILNQTSLITYTIKDGEKCVPLFYFDNNNISNKIALSHNDWAIPYLRFCCKLQGIKDEIFENRNYTEVVKLDDLKLMLPERTKIEEVWPRVCPTIYKKLILD